MELPVHKVGRTGKPGAQVLRVVHISDTHMRHVKNMKNLPEGDILIHSGDFSAFSLGRCFSNKTVDRDAIIEELNNFFRDVNFKHKIFVAGNHELSFNEQSRSYVKEKLTEAHYLQDESVLIDGLTIYGSPWNSKRWTSYARAFARNAGKLEKKWKLIPTETDILVTHMPPQGILDLAMKKFSGIKNLFSQNSPCEICGGDHEMNEHWGCRDLKNVVLKTVRPILHLFGHVHEDTGVLEVDGVTFSNAAMKIKQTINVFDVYV